MKRFIFVLSPEEWKEGFDENLKLVEILKSISFLKLA